MHLRGLFVGGSGNGEEGMLDGMSEALEVCLLWATAKTSEVTGRASRPSNQLGLCAGDAARMDARRSSSVCSAASDSSGRRSNSSVSPACARREALKATMPEMP